MMEAARAYADPGMAVALPEKKCPGRGCRIMRQEKDGQPKSEADKYKDAGLKALEAFVETDQGKRIKEKATKMGSAFLGTLPGKVITGSAIAGVITAVAATNSPLPMQIPAIPLDKVIPGIPPGLKVKFTYEGPVRSPTAASVMFTFETGSSPTYPRSKPADRGDPLGDIAKFREMLKSPEQRAAEDEQFRRAYWGMKNPLGLDPLKIPGLEKKDEETPVQRKASGPAPAGGVTPAVRETLSSPGKPLDAATRNFMEARFGYDFGRVRVHTDARAAESARSINAVAYAAGTNIVFDEGRYSPGITEGKRLLAHELMHVVQQGTNIVHSSDLSVAPGKTAEEEQADSVSGLIASGHVPGTGLGGIGDQN